MPEPIRVVIAEDNYLVREGTRRLLEDSGEVQVVAAVGTAEELLDAVDRLMPNAVLTDIRMPPGHDMEGMLRVDLFFLDGADDLVQQRAILQHE